FDRADNTRSDLRRDRALSLNSCAPAISNLWNSSSSSWLRRLYSSFSSGAFIRHLLDGSLGLRRRSGGFGVVTTLATKYTEDPGHVKAGQLLGGDAFAAQLPGEGAEGVVAEWDLIDLGDAAGGGLVDEVAHHA